MCNESHLEQYQIEITAGDKDVSCYHTYFEYIDE